MIRENTRHTSWMLHRDKYAHYSQEIENVPLKRPSFWVDGVGKGRHLIAWTNKQWPSDQVTALACYVQFQKYIVQSQAMIKQGLNIFSFFWEFDTTSSVRLRPFEFSWPSLSLGVRCCTYTKITRRMTLSNLKSSQNVLMRRSTRRKDCWTNSMDLYLVSDNFIARNLVSRRHELSRGMWCCGAGAGVNNPCWHSVWH